MAAADVAALKSLVREALQHKGVLGRVKAELRASVFTILQEREFSKSGVYPPNHLLREILDTWHGRLAIDLIRDFLEFLHLNSTLSVLIQEASLPTEYCGHRRVGDDLHVTENGRLPVLCAVVRDAEEHWRGVVTPAYRSPRGHQHDAACHEGVHAGTQTEWAAAEEGRAAAARQPAAGDASTADRPRFEREETVDFGAVEETADARGGRGGGAGGATEKPHPPHLEKQAAEIRRAKAGAALPAAGPPRTEDSGLAGGPIAESRQGTAFLGSRDSFTGTDEEDSDREEGYVGGENRQKIADVVNEGRYVPTDGSTETGARIRASLVSPLTSTDSIDSNRNKALAEQDSLQTRSGESSEASEEEEGSGKEFSAAPRASGSGPAEDVRETPNRFRPPDWEGRAGPERRPPELLPRSPPAAGQLRRGGGAEQRPSSPAAVGEAAAGGGADLAAFRGGNVRAPLEAGAGPRPEADVRGCTEPAQVPPEAEAATSDRSVSSGGSSRYDVAQSVRLKAAADAAAAAAAELEPETTDRTASPVSAAEFDHVEQADTAGGRGERGAEKTSRRRPAGTAPPRQAQADAETDGTALVTSDLSCSSSLASLSFDHTEVVRPRPAAPAAGPSSSSSSAYSWVPRPPASFRRSGAEDNRDHFTSDRSASSPLASGEFSYVESFKAAVGFGKATWADFEMLTSDQSLSTSSVCRSAAAAGSASGGDDDDDNDDQNWRRTATSSAATGREGLDEDDGADDRASSPPFDYSETAVFAGK